MNAFKFRKQNTVVMIAIVYPYYTTIINHYHITIDFINIARLL
jgi:hypothetical protein